MALNGRCVPMDLVRGLSRFVVLAAVLALFAVAWPAVPASGQDVTPACSNGVDDDSDGAIDGADAGCAGGSDDNETDSPYAGIKFITVPLPLVTLQGTVDDMGNVNVSRLQVRAQRGSVVAVTCQGAKCPFISLDRRMITSSLRLKPLERKLKAPMTLTFKIGRPQQLGKFVQYKLRRGKPPARKDACIAQDTQKVGPCYQD